MSYRISHLYTYNIAVFIAFIFAGFSDIRGNTIGFTKLKSKALLISTITTDLLFLLLRNEIFFGHTVTS